MGDARAHGDELLRTLLALRTIEHRGQDCQAYNARVSARERHKTPPPGPKRMAIAGGSSLAPRVETIVIPPRAEHTATVFFIHVSIYIFSAASLLTTINQGLGQEADSWVPTLQRVVDRLPEVKWILPQAYVYWI